MRGVVTNIQRLCRHDGPGLRSTVFLKGCPLSCPWCANPESQDANPEVSFRPAMCIGCGRCAAQCPEHAITLVDGKYVYTTTSHTGVNVPLIVTVSAGMLKFSVTLQPLNV